MDKMAVKFSTKLNNSGNILGPIIEYYREFYPGEVLGYISITKTGSKVFRKIIYSDLNRDELSDKCTQYFTTIRNPHQRLLSGILEYQRRLYLKQINPSDDIQLSTKRPLFPWQDFDSEAVSDVNTLLYYLLNTGLAPFDEHLEPQVNFFDVKKINKKPVLACRFENQHTLVPAMWSNKHIIHRALEKHLIPWVEINIKQFDKPLIEQCVREHYYSDWLLWKNLPRDKVMQITPQFS